MNDVAPDRTETLVVPPGADGERLDRILAAHLGALSRSRLKALIENGNVRVDGTTITEPSRRVKPGQRLAVAVPAPVPAAPAAQPLDLAVVHEDEAIIVIDKPAGMVVHPAPGNPDRTLVNALLAHCGDSLRGIGGERRPGIVHRIDKDTSGLVVAAKTEAAHAALAAQFAAHSIDRVYTALVWGVPRPRAGTVEGAIGRDPRNRKRMALVARGGKAAVTHYRVVDVYDDAAALVECRLETGRTHQIRVHMASRGHPLVGDPLYARARGRRTAQLPAAVRDALTGFARQALHAGTLGLDHPTTRHRLNFTTPLPHDFRDLIQCLESLKAN